MNCWKNLKMRGKLGVAALVLAVGIISVAGCTPGPPPGPPPNPPSTSASSDVSLGCFLTTKALSFIAAAIEKNKDPAAIVAGAGKIINYACKLRPLIDALINNTKIDGQKYSITDYQVSQLPPSQTRTNLRCLLLSQC